MIAMNSGKKAKKGISPGVVEGPGEYMGGINKN
jgi:hypothetical protein